MHEDQEFISRRRFLHWTAAGAAGVGASILVPAAEAQTAPGMEPKAPLHPLSLRSPEMEVVLDAANGLPFEYRLLKNSARLRGEDLGTPVDVTLCRVHPWAFKTSPIAPAGHRSDHNSVTFLFHAAFDGTPAAQFSIRYMLHQCTVMVMLEGVVERSGFQLIDVNMPRLVTVRESDESAWLAHGDQGGSVAMLAEAKPGTLAPNTFWGNVMGTLPVVMVGTSRALCVQETTAVMDGTLLAITGAAGSRRGSMGTDKVHRVNGSACYDLNLGRGLPHNCGVSSTPNLLVEETSSCRLDFMPVTGDPEKAWMAAAKLMRSRMPKIPTTFYNDKYVYGIRCDEPLYPRPSSTFEQCAEIIRRVAALTDNSPQVVHLWGWQFRGKDTGYPAINVVNERIGGYDGMMRLMQQGADVNATVTLSDNYDDAYRSSPAWDEKLIARRPDGELWKSRAWTGEESYILGLAKYMEGPGPERIRYTCERYKLKHTTHIDVLSYYAIRNDWDPQNPASGIRNLRDGRYKVLEQFAAQGVDVSSEALRYPMIGHISSFWYLTGPAPCPFGGKAIPLVPLIYGASAVWGLSGAGVRGDAATVRILERFYGACPHSILRADSDPALFLDAFYLGMVPFFVLRGRVIEDFERKDDWSRIHLEGNAVIESDLAAKTMRITLDGVEVLRDDAVFCPLYVSSDGRHADGARIACYSVRAQTIDVPIPTGWDLSRITASTLYADRREPAIFQRKGNLASIALEARRPVILYAEQHQS